MASFFRETGYMGVGLLASGLGGLALNIGLGRVLSGAEYGTFRIFFSSILLVGWILAFGIERDVTAQLSAMAGDDGRVLDVAAALLAGIATLFVVTSLVGYGLVVDVLGAPELFLPFVVGSLVFLLYRATMGVLKGVRRMRLVGLQNLVLGVLKVSIVLAVLVAGLSSVEIAVVLALLYSVVVVLSLYWARDVVAGIGFESPPLATVRSVLFSTTKQIGDVTIKFGGPLVVGVLGGSDVSAGIFGAALTLAFVPYYGYRAVINTILPEVSELHSKEDAVGISRRIGFLLEVTVVLLAGWTAFGYLLGPWLVPFVYQPTFQIAALTAGLVFFVSSCLILSSLLTEVLIGLDAQQDVAKSWLSPLFLFPAGAFLPVPAIDATAITFGTYIAVVTVLLLSYLHFTRVPLQYTGFDYRVFD